LAGNCQEFRQNRQNCLIIAEIFHSVRVPEIIGNRQLTDWWKLVNALNFRRELKMAIRHSAQ